MYSMYSAAGRAGARNYTPRGNGRCSRESLCGKPHPSFFLKLNILQCGKNNVKSGRRWKDSKSGSLPRKAVGLACV